MWLWNDTVPELFNGPAIGVWKAWELTVLTSMLFKSYTGKNSA